MKSAVGSSSRDGVLASTGMTVARQDHSLTQQGVKGVREDVRQLLSSSAHGKKKILYNNMRLSQRGKTTAIVVVSPPFFILFCLSVDSVLSSLLFISIRPKYIKKT